MDVITLSQKDFLEKCHDLSTSINYKPDLLIGISQGGVFVMNALKGSGHFTNTTFMSAHLEVPGRLKKQKSRISPILKVLPRQVVNSLRKLEISYNQRTLKTLDISQLTNLKVHLEPQQDSTFNPERILIVDDALDTGKTMFAVKHKVQQIFNNADIKIAVLTWTINTAIIQPDFYLYKNVLIRFPWSLDYE